MATREFSLLPLGALLKTTSHVDRVLLPYYLVMHVWTAIGNGAVALRMLSVLAGAVTVAVSARTAQIAWGSIAAVITGIALAANGQFVGTSVDARPYALVLLFTAVATHSLVRIMSGPATRRAWLTYCAAVSIAVLMQALAILILLPHAIPFWRRERRSLVSRWLLATTLPVLLTLVLVVGNSQRSQLAWIRRGSISDAIHNFITSSGESFHALPLILAVVFVLVLQVKRRFIDDVWAMSLGILIVPTAVLFLVSDLFTPVLVGRYVVSQLLGAALLLGAGGQFLSEVISSRHLARGLAAGMVIVVIVGASFAGLRVTLRSTVAAGDNYPALVRELTAQARVGDELIIRQGYSLGGFADGVAYYLRDAAFMGAITQRLPNGEPSQYERIVDRTSPFSTANVQSGAYAANVWVVQKTQSATPTTQQLLAHGCVPIRVKGDRFQQFGAIFLLLFRCP